MGYDCTMHKGFIPPRDCGQVHKIRWGGFQTNHSVNLYTSNNLADWTFVANILPDSP